VGQPFERLVHPRICRSRSSCGRGGTRRGPPRQPVSGPDREGRLPRRRFSATPQLHEGGRRHPGDRARRHGARPAGAAAAAKPRKWKRSAGWRAANRAPRLQQHPHGHHGHAICSSRTSAPPIPCQDADEITSRRSRRGADAPAVGVQPPAGPAAGRCSRSNKLVSDLEKMCAGSWRRRSSSHALGTDHGRVRLIPDSLEQ